ncbi:hypothetical protein WJX72_011618 [[Myrmecia] bisecta]|uniref:MRG domain-containing protein n=1 Tax=[Myrmecia] bisecta TaxID=41462 RepID=A0AAW1QGL4_9CHLO
MGQRDRGPFRVGERVLVPHTDKYYEAKTLKSQKREDGIWYYLLHYQGWNKKWDEWVEAPGLVKYDAKLAEVDLSQEDKGGPDGKGKKRKLEEGEAGEEDGPQDTFDKAAHIQVEVPPALKKVLLDDWERITRDGKLVPLPRRPSVRDILQQYVDANRAKKDLTDAEEEIASGLRTYFDKACGRLLLYNQERKQAEQVLTEACVPSNIYGGEHLLRLLVKLPELLPIVSIAPDDKVKLETRILEFVRFLTTKQAAFFLAASQYQAAPH